MGSHPRSLRRLRFHHFFQLLPLLFRQRLDKLCRGFHRLGYFTANILLKYLVAWDRVHSSSHERGKHPGPKAVRASHGVGPDVCGGICSPEEYLLSGCELALEPGPPSSGEGF